MKYINKNQQKHPDIVKFEKQQGDWTSLSTPLKQKVSAILRNEQWNKCAYCEDTLPNIKNSKAITYSHMEHIYPKTVYKDKTFNYNNVVISCGKQDSQGLTINHCGHKKDNYDPQKGFISPLQDDCESYFDYTFDGKIVPSNNQQNALTTITILNLNDSELCEKRKSIIDSYLFVLKEGSEDLELDTDSFKKLLDALIESDSFYTTHKVILQKLIS